MGAREIANADLKKILEDRDTGFGWDIIVTDPDGNTQALVGRSGDVAQMIDPDTGQAVSGRIASVSLAMASITLGLPVAITDSASKPWLMQFDDIEGVAHTFKVIQSNPDRTLGLVTCLLGEYDPNPD